MTEEQFRLTVMQAAIHHAKKEARQPAQRRDVALFFLKTVYQDLKHKRSYRQAMLVHEVLRECEKSKLITSYLERLQSEAGLTVEQPPFRNTGVSSLGERAVGDNSGVSEEYVSFFDAVMHQRGEQ
jgi:hypothetical protein